MKHLLKTAIMYNLKILNVGCTNAIFDLNKNTFRLELFSNGTELHMLFETVMDSSIFDGLNVHIGDSIVIEWDVTDTAPVIDLFRCILDIMDVDLMTLVKLDARGLRVHYDVYVGGGF